MCASPILLPARVSSFMLHDVRDGQGGGIYGCSRFWTIRMSGELARDGSSDCVLVMMLKGLLGGSVCGSCCCRCSCMHALESSLVVTRVVCNSIDSNIQSPKPQYGPQHNRPPQRVNRIPIQPRHTIPNNTIHPTAGSAAPLLTPSPDSQRNETLADPRTRIWPPASRVMAMMPLTEASSAWRAP